MMKNLFRIALLFSATGLLRGQATDNEAVKLLQAAIEAHGGVQVISSIKDATFTGRAWSIGKASQSYSFVTKTQDLDRVRTEVNGSDFNQTFVSSGDFGWVVANGKKQSLFTHQTANKLIEVNPVLGLLAAFAHNRLEIDYVGEVIRDSRPTHHVLAYLRDPNTVRKTNGQSLDSRYDVFIDAGTGRMTALEFRRLGMGSERENTVDEYRYTDYRAAEGVLVPFQIDHLHNGRPIKRLVVETFSLASHGASFAEP